MSNEKIESEGDSSVNVNVMYREESNYDWKGRDHKREEECLYKKLQRDADWKP